MLSQDMQRLFRRLLALALLTGCLMVFSGERRVQALTCCDNCNNNYASCFQSCGGDPVCQEECGNKFDACESRCWQLYHQLC